MVRWVRWGGGGEIVRWERGGGGLKQLLHSNDVSFQSF